MIDTQVIMSTTTTPITSSSSSSTTGNFAVESTSMSSSPWIPLDGTEPPNVPWNGPNLRTMVHDDNDLSVEQHHTIHPDDTRNQTNHTTDDDQVDPLVHNFDDCDALSPPAHDPLAVQLEEEDGNEIMIRDGHAMMLRAMEETGYFTEEYPVGDDNTSTTSVKKVLYPLRDLSVRRSGILATFVSHTNTGSSTSIVLVLQLYDPPYTVLALCFDDRIQYAIPYHDPLSPSPAHQQGPSIQLTCRAIPIYEMMTHIPMCSVKCEPSYILIWNATVSRRTGNQRRQRQRNSNHRMTGYGIVQQLLRYYASSIYKIVLVEEDPAIYDIYKSYFDTNPVVREEERVTVVHHPPFDDPQNDVSSLEGRYHVIFVIDDHDPVDDNTLVNVNAVAVDRVEINLPSSSHAQPTPPLRDSYRHCIYRALVPNGGVACFLTRPNNVNENDSTVPMKYEYAALPTVALTSIESSETILQLCIRWTNHHDTAAVDAPTCRRPIRTPTTSSTLDTTPLHWYSSDTHVSAFTLPPMIQRQLFPKTTTCTTTAPVQEMSEQTPTMPTTRATPSGLDDVKIENDDTTTCRPFGGIGENVHRWIQRHWSNVTTKFALIPQ